MEFAQTFSIKYSELPKQNYSSKRCSLNIEEVCKHPQAFPSGERGPRGAVNEESGVCAAQRARAPIISIFSLIAFSIKKRY